MGGNSASPSTLPTLLIFGPQIALPDSEVLSRLRLVLISESRLSRFLAAIKDLPKLWRSLMEEHPKFNAVPGSKVLEDLQSWIENGGNLPKIFTSQPNVLLSPLTIILQITHYVHFLNVMQMRDDKITHQTLLKSLKVGGAQGLCVGILSAIALAYSVDVEDLADRAAVALRLAVFVGAVVDAEGSFAAPPREASCFAVRYEVGQDKLIQELVGNFPEVSSDNTPSEATF